MKIETIFVDEFEGLHSIKYPEEEFCEFNRLFEIWFDREYLLKYCKKNAEYIFNDYWRFNRLEDFIEMIVEEADRLLQVFETFAENGFGANSRELQKIFLPLINRIVFVPALQKSKAKAETNKGKLRLYALRVDDNTFVVTGGCIKLTHRMEEHVDTLKELKKMDYVSIFLKENGIYNQDNLACYYEQSEY